MHKTGMSKNRIIRMLLLAVVFAAGLGIGVRFGARKASGTSENQEAEGTDTGSLTSAAADTGSLTSAAADTGSLTSAAADTGNTTADAEATEETGNLLADVGTTAETGSTAADTENLAAAASGTETSAAGMSETSTETVAAGVEALLLAESENAGTDDSEGAGTVLENFPLVEQYPELPTGCEITALTMVLQYYGFEVSKMTMALEYLPTVADEQYRGRDGKLYGSDLENYFVGDPTTESGYVCGTGAIVTAAEAFLEDQGSDLTVSAMEGVSPDTLYDLLDEGIPAVIWCTIGMESRAETQGWYRSDGTYMEWSTNDHGAVLIGYDEDTVTVADPIDGLCEYSRTQFEKVFAQRGQKCVILT